eukprot:UN25753
MERQKNCVEPAYLQERSENDRKSLQRRKIMERQEKNYFHPEDDRNSDHREKKNDIMHDRPMKRYFDPEYLQELSEKERFSRQRRNFMERRRKEFFRSPESENDRNRENPEYKYMRRKQKSFFPPDNFDDFRKNDRERERPPIIKRFFDREYLQEKEDERKSRERKKIMEDKSTFSTLNQRMKEIQATIVKLHRNETRYTGMKCGQHLISTLQMVWNVTDM